MQENSDGHALVALLKACANQKNLHRGSKLHADIVRMGLLEKDMSIGNTLVSMYSKCGSFTKAQEVLRQLPDRNVVSWNALIAGYAQYGQDADALDCFDRMQSEGISPSAVTFACVLKACGSIGATSKGHDIHTEILREGLLDKDAVVGNALVGMYAKGGLLAKACEVFHRLPFRSVVSWNALITGYIQHGFNEEVLNCFEQMQVEGMSPNSITFVCILKACGSLGATCKGHEIHAEIIRRGLIENDVLVGTALVSMYAKCGLVKKAQEVFDKLPVRDVVSWSALIAGYALHENNEEALNCFHRMQHEGVSPDAVTFICILKVCGSIGAADKGQKVHAESIREGLLEKHIAIGTALIDMYAKCGLLAQAHEVFDSVPDRDVVIWNSLIAGYAQQGHAEEALKCFEQMQLEGIDPSMVTYICSLKACGSVGAAEIGQEIHAEILKEGLFDKDLGVGNALVDMYTKCGLLAKAHQVFDKFLVRNVVLYNALIGGYTQQGHDEEALYCLEQMRCEGIPPNLVTFTCICKVCGNTGAACKGQEIHAVIMTEGMLAKDIDVGNALVDMYAKCGLLAKAQEVLNRLPVRNIASWNALIGGYAQLGHGEEAMNCFEQMQLETISPNTVTFVCMLKACGSIRAADRGQELHAHIVKEQLLKTDVIVGNALVDMYVKCGLLAKAQEVLDKLPVRNLVSWNALIAGYVHHGYDEEAVNCFERMQREGMVPDEVTFVCILKACGSTGAVKKGEEVHAKIVREGLLEEDVLIGIALVDMYAKCGLLEKSQEMFDKISVRNVAAWNMLITGYVQFLQGEKALGCFEQMHLEGIYPDTLTFVCILKVCSSIGAADKGQKMHAELGMLGWLKNDCLLGNTLMDMYIKCGLLARAEEVFGNLPVQDLVSWNALIAGYALLGRDERVFWSLEQMMRDGIKPNTITFTSVLNACSHTGLLDKGQMYFETMSTRYGVIPTVMHHSCMVDLFGRAGHLSKVIGMIKRMPFLATLSVWHTVLRACREQGNMELGRLSFQHAMQLDEKDAAAYLCMGNIYSALDAGWEETVDRLYLS